MEKIEKEEEVILVDRKNKKQGKEKDNFASGDNGNISENRADSKVENKSYGKTLIDQETKVFEFPRKPNLEYMDKSLYEKKARNKNIEENANRQDEVSKLNQYKGNGSNVKNNTSEEELIMIKSNRNNNANKHKVDNSNRNIINEATKIANSVDSRMINESELQNKSDNKFENKSKNKSGNRFDNNFENKPKNKSDNRFDNNFESKPENKFDNSFDNKLRNKSNIKTDKNINQNLHKHNDMKKNTEKEIGKEKNNNVNQNVYNSAVKLSEKDTGKKNSKENSKSLIKKQDYEIEKKEKSSKDKKSKKGLMVLLIIFIIVLIAIIFSTIFSFITWKSDKIIKGVYINNIEVSNLTKQDAITKLENELNNEDKNVVTIKHNDYSREIHLSEFGGKFDVISAVDTAYNLGRGSNIITENYKILNTMYSNENIMVNFSYDEDLLKGLIDKISLELPDLVTASSYVIDGNKLIIKNGKDGVKIQQEDFANNLESTFTGKNKSFEIPVEKCEKEEIDIEKIHSEIYKAPVNAYYTTNPYKIVKEENGLDFEIGLDAAKKLLQEDKDEYIIKLKTVKPKVTVNTLNSEAFPDLLSTFTTNYGTGDVGRNTNIALAAKSINSVVVMPGEVFSYNDLIGECSTRTGYKESTIYLNGELAKGVGGGICQVSTTLYNTVLRANLEIVERRNHSLSVTYVPLGHDAMVSIGSSDFKFKNNRNYPIKVVATTGTGSITCQIYGLKQSPEYEVKLESKVISKTDTKTKVETYKILYLNGVEKSRTLLSVDTYKNH